MAHDIGIYCSEKDNQELLEYIKSIGLNILPFNLQKGIGKPDEIRYLYLSPYTLNKLTPYGEPPKIRPTVNQIFEMRRPYYKDNKLVLGVITLETHPQEFYKELKPYYMKIVRWIRKNYEKRVDSYYGKEAQVLIDKHGALDIN